MSRFFPRALLPVVCLLSIPLFSQEASVLRIGIAALRSGTDKVSVTEARDRLVKGLNQRKPDKKLKVLIQSVALDASLGSQAIAEAKAKGCQLVLFSVLTDLLTGSKQEVTSLQGSVQDIPTITAKIEYQLQRVTDGSEYAIGSAVGEDSSSNREAMLQAMGKVAAQVMNDLRKGGNLPAGEPAAAESVAKQTGSQTVQETLIATNYCAWLPTDIPHSEALRGVCEFAISLPQKMPNFVCDQETSRYRGESKVPRDLITASVRYEDGNETYSGIRLNGKAAPSAITQSPGLWSTGEFGTNLRAIFNLRNSAAFAFLKEASLGPRAAWVFTYQIAHQNDPLWRLHGGDDVLAPPYGGELWVDQKNGDLLRFQSTAKEIPPTFPMQSADLLTDYDHVSFGDGTAFVLPVTATVATRFRGEEATRNVVQFRNCQKFRAKTHIVLGTAGSTDVVAPVNRAANSADVVQQELAESETIYAVLREQAIREDAARLQDDQKIDLNSATLDRLRRLAALEKESQKNQFELEARAEKESTIAAARKNATPSFKVSVKLVQVSVVLRDPKGRAVGNLRKEDFQLFDNRSPQKITSFSLETSAHAPENSAGQDATKATGAADDEKPSSPGERDVGYVFDDLHTTFADLAGSRDAASRRIAALREGDRAAIFTTSGEVQLTFTSNRDKLQEALRALRPHPIRSTANCPPLTLFTANLVVQGDLDALSTAIQDTVNCEFGGMASSPAELQRAEQVARRRALEVLNAGSAENQSTLSSLQEVIRRVAEAQGSRVIVLVSPGFLTQTPETREAVMDLIDRAVRSNIVIHTLDVKGLATSGVSGDSQRPSSPQRLQLTSAEVSAQGEVMAEFAYGTGGTYFHNSNDLDEGFRRTADPPEYIYVLGFSPQKLDGKFHKLKVTFSGPEKLTLQAREGYYALKPGSEK